MPQIILINLAMYVAVLAALIALLVWGLRRHSNRRM